MRSRLVLTNFSKLSGYLADYTILKRSETECSFSRSENLNVERQQPAWPSKLEEVFKVFGGKDKVKSNVALEKSLKVLHFLKRTDMWSEFQDLNQKLGEEHPISPVSKKSSANSRGSSIKKFSMDHFPKLLFTSDDAELAKLYFDRLSVNNRLENTKNVRYLIGSCILSLRWNRDFKNMMSQKFIEPLEPAYMSKFVHFEMIGLELWKK